MPPILEIRKFEQRVSPLSVEDITGSMNVMSTDDERTDRGIVIEKMSKFPSAQRYRKAAL